MYVVFHMSDGHSFSSGRVFRNSREVLREQMIMIHEEYKDKIDRSIADLKRRRKENNETPIDYDDEDVELNELLDRIDEEFERRLSLIREERKRLQKTSHKGLLKLGSRRRQ